MPPSCQACLQVLPNGARFCHACGVPTAPAEDLRVSGPATTAPPERRNLTVAFCDLVGSTELSSRLDPEEYSELIQTYQERSVAVAATYAGWVESYSGDGILFRFGWPEAHDDDAERAVRASLEILSAMADLGTGEHSLQVRIGVHSGPVVVGEMGGTGQRGMVALGVTMNLAARLTTVAAPKSVVVSAATLQLVRGLFITQSLGFHHLKGIPTAVETHRVVQPSGVRSHLDAAKGSLSPFVGRASERAWLAEAWESAARGSGRALLISGEPGVGKSRLAFDLRERLREASHTWLECGGSAFTQGSVLRPAIQLIESGLRLRPEDDPAQRWSKLERGLSGIGMKEESSVALMATLLGIPLPDGITPLTMSPDQHRKRTVELLVTGLIELARLQPLVLLVEDLQWVDPSTLEFLGALVRHSRKSSLLLMMTARSEFESPWTTEVALEPIALDPLQEPDIRSLVLGIGGGRPWHQPVFERIVSDSGGIPLFAEELGRAVFDSMPVSADPGEWSPSTESGRIEIPTTLQGSLMARLDRLGPAKLVAQAASVVGRGFDFRLLAATTYIESASLIAALRELVSNDLIYQDGEPPDSTYVFKHALVQEAAYRCLLRRTRRVLHERVAEELRLRQGSGFDVPAEVIARHFEAAGRTEDAVEFYRLAGEEAGRRSGCREAIAYFQKGIELLGQVPSTLESQYQEIDLQLALGSSIIAARSYADPGIEAAYGRAAGLCETLGDDARIGAALAGLSIFYTNRGDIARGTKLGEQVLAIGLERSDDTLELLGRIQMAHPLLYLGRTEEALAHADRAVAIYDPLRHSAIADQFGTDHGVAGHNFAAWALLLLGYGDGALGHLDDAVALAKQLGQPFNLAYALLFKAIVHWIRGESDLLLESARQCHTIAVEQGFSLWTGLSRLFEVSEHIILTGDASLLPDAIEASLVAGESGNRGGSTAVLARLAEAHWAAHDPGGAGAIVEMAFGVSKETGQVWWDGELHRMAAELRVAEAEEAARAGTRRSAEVRLVATRAEQELHKAIRIARQRRYPFHELRAATALVRLPGRDRRHDQAVDILRTACAHFPEGPTTPVARAGLALLRQLEGPVEPRRADQEPFAPKR